MRKKRIVLITGVADYWGRRVASRLLREADWQVIGLDTAPPPETINGLDFILAPPDDPLIVELLAEERVEVLCHLAFTESTQPNPAAFQHNVIGTLKLFSACAQAGLRRIVYKSSTAVYGARPANPAFLAEDHPLAGSRHYGYTRDLIEVETFCQNLARQTSSTALTLLRFANIVGPTADSPLTRFLRSRRAPILLGFDPMMQVIHEDDVVEALAIAVINDVSGVFNVAAAGPLSLLQVMALAGKVPMPIFHPLAYRGVRRLARSPARLEAYAPLGLDYLRYPWVGDTTKMSHELGFTPRYTAAEAVRAWAQPGNMPPETIAASLNEDEAGLRAIIERRRQARAGQAS